MNHGAYTLHFRKHLAAIYVYHLQYTFYIILPFFCSLEAPKVWTDYKDKHVLQGWRPVVCARVRASERVHAWT